MTKLETEAAELCVVFFVWCPAHHKINWHNTDSAQQKCWLRLARHVRSEKRKAMHKGAAFASQFAGKPD